MDKKIKIIINGPYIVSGGIPLSQKTIVPEGEHYELRYSKAIKTSGDYALCRCGKTKTPPFCDGSHLAEHFDGTETAPRNNFCDRAEKLEGEEIDLLDDVSLCAYARFCHTEKGSVWELITITGDPAARDELVKAACECPAGRLVAYDKAGNAIEPDLEPEIEILIDQELGVSGPIYVKGNIPVISADGYIYEVRNRVTLCRCGKSSNKPFCDTSHKNPL